MKILEELYYGNIRADGKVYDQNSPYVQLVQLRENNRKELLLTLNENEKVIFQKFNDAQAEIDGITQYQKFTYGLRFGVMLMSETFNNCGEVVNDYE